MNLFGMGPMEILVIAVVALIIFGPGRLPEIGAQAGKAVRDFRKATTSLTSEFQDSINDVQATVGELKDTVRDVQRETQALGKSIPDSLTGPIRKPVRSGSAVESLQIAAVDDGADVESEAPDPSDPTIIGSPTEPVIPEIAATRADPFADLAALEDDEVVAKPVISRA